MKLYICTILKPLLTDTKVGEKKGRNNAQKSKTKFKEKHNRNFIIKKQNKREEKNYTRVHVLIVSLFIMGWEFIYKITWQERMTQNE